MRLRGAALALLLLTACGGADTPAGSPAASSLPVASRTPAPTPAESATPGPAATPTPAAGGDLGPVDRRAELHRQGRAALEQVCRGHGDDPNNPWALAHGILAFGPEFTTRDGQPAAEHMLRTYLEQIEVRGRSVAGFQAQRSETERIEPHRDLILKSLLGSGYTLDQEVGGVRIDDLYQGAAWRFEVNPDQPEHPFPDGDDVAWSMDAFCRAERDDSIDREAPVRYGAAQLELEQVAALVLDLMEHETEFIAEAMASGAQLQKRRQGVWGHTCGGAHLLQGVLTCAELGFPSGDDVAARIQKQIEIMLWRLPFETQLVSQMVQQAPQYQGLLVNQDIKFLGHLFETLAIAQRAGFLELNAELAQQIETARDRLMLDAVRLSQSGIYGGMDTFRTSEGTYQFYLDLIGDACHAIHGLDAWDEVAPPAP